MVRERLRSGSSRLAPITGVVFALACAPAAADLYRWVDAKGVVNYSNVPPQGISARQIAESAPTVSEIPLPEKRPELQQAQREAAMLRRIEQLESELAALRRASAPTVVYSYPVPIPTETYALPMVYPYPIVSWPVQRPGGGHRFKPYHPGSGSHWRPGGRTPVAVPHGGRSGLTVRARF